MDSIIFYGGVYNIHEEGIIILATYFYLYKRRKLTMCHLISLNKNSSNTGV